MRRGEVLSGAKSVEHPQDSRVDTPQCADRVDVVFRCQLGDRIGRMRAGGHFFVDRLRLLVAVDRTGGDEYHPSDPDIAHRFHQADGAAHINSIVFFGVEHRLGDKYARRQVVDAVHILEQGPQFGAVVDIPAGEMHVLEQGLWLPGGKVVQSAHLVSFPG